MKHELCSCSMSIKLNYWCMNAYISIITNDTGYAVKIRQVFMWAREIIKNPHSVWCEMPERPGASFVTVIISVKRKKNLTLLNAVLINSVRGVMWWTEDFTLGADTWHVLDCGSRTTRATGGNARFFFNLPQVAGGIFAGNGFHQVRASLQRSACLP